MLEEETTPSWFAGNFASPQTTMQCGPGKGILDGPESSTGAIKKVADSPILELSGARSVDEDRRGECDRFNLQCSVSPAKVEVAPVECSCFFQGLLVNEGLQ